MKLFLLTAVTMGAFAANSLLARAALLEPAIDPGSFSAIRLASGALSLIGLHRARGGTRLGGSWRSSLGLLLYAIPFSYAYVTLATGTGALILFGCVQLSMLAYAILSKERLGPRKWVGMGAAALGLVTLLLPGLSAPDPRGASLMAVAGLGWGLYTLAGKGSKDPLSDTAGNFLRSVPAALVLALFVLISKRQEVSLHGVFLGIISGSLTSGVGYALWYSVLPRLSASTAAVVQLTVPMLAALFGVLLLGELLTVRLLGAAALILGGLSLVILPPKRPS